MICRITDDFDLRRIAESGQTFRWEASSDGAYRVIHGASCLRIASLGEDRYTLDCDEAEFIALWWEYFDLDTSYRGIRARIDGEKDPYLRSAAEAQKGIRILRQDPWETLVSFIISQNKNIPAIRRSIELLAQACGEALEDRWGEPYFAFPTPQALASLDEDALKACRLGYRCAYVHAAAEAVCEGTLDLDALRTADEATTMAKLTGLFGVGPKVASCVSLFGLHHLNAFPEDVWIRRVLSEHYPQGYPKDAYAPYNGVYQQYLFAHARELAAQ